MAKGKVSEGESGGFKAKLWAAADKMSSHMDPAEYKHVVLGIIFLKYISDSFQERHDALQDEPRRLDTVIETNLESLGYTINEYSGFLRLGDGTQRPAW